MLTFPLLVSLRSILSLRPSVYLSASSSAIAWVGLRRNFKIVRQWIPENLKMSVVAMIVNVVEGIYPQKRQIEKIGKWKKTFQSMKPVKLWPNTWSKRKSFEIFFTLIHLCLPRAIKKDGFDLKAYDGYKLSKAGIHAITRAFQKQVDLKNNGIIFR